MTTQKGQSCKIVRAQKFRFQKFTHFARKFSSGLRIQESNAAYVFFLRIHKKLILKSIYTLKVAATLHCGLAKVGV